jgi:hypothetical protein
MLACLLDIRWALSLDFAWVAQMVAMKVPVMALRMAVQQSSRLLHS